MATAFTNSYVILSQEHADHINERHVDLDKETGASKFARSFNLTSTLTLLTRKTFEDSNSYEIVEKGFKTGHCYYFMYVFNMSKAIGTCPDGFETNKLCIYFSWKKAYGDRFKIISAYPFSHAYHIYLKRRRLMNN
ncbi:hypothetical protein OS493_022083 [Desmophyllum pertusum]|uniref:Uncharacterized protein n=1 Tax=Desmophyllum pertusum TaxID=174260 RepID=A0A9X0CLT3_9CNID|nr:hypothetical protein OS493_022083 [Desmophyllum pertusum]